MKKVFVLIVLLIAVIGCTQNPPAKEKKDSGVQLENNNEEKTETVVEISFSNEFYFVNSIGYYHITGVVENTGNVPVKFVRAKITAVKADGKNIVFDDVITYPSRLAPGQKGGFDFSMGSPDDYKVGEFTAETGYFKIDEAQPYTELEVSEEEVLDNETYYTLSANVKNTGQEQAPMYWVNAVFFDSQGHVLATGTDAITKNGEGLIPEDEKLISFFVAHPSESNRITNHIIAVEFSE